MKNLMSRRIPAVFVTAAILFTTVFSMCLLANAASSFTPRLTAPSSSNEYYYSNKNVFYKYGYGMPNCTAYAYGRAYEILKSEPKLSWGNAELWYGYNKSNGYYDYGSAPKVGAIACWSYDGGGHVAVVEKIEDGTITLSNSAYSGTNFYLTYASTTDPKVGGNSWWTFQGYIYLGNFSAESATTAPATSSSTYKPGVYQTQVTSSLNMRSGAGTNYSCVASIPNGVKLTVTKVTASGDYNWGYTTYNGITGWVALDYCKFISDIPATEPTAAEKATTQPATAKPLGVGDVNLDGKISVLDATEIQKHLAGVVTLTDEQLSYCDFDFDGKITVMDATAIQKYLAY